MFVNVQTLLFDTRRNPQSMCQIQSLEDQEAHAECPTSDDGCSEKLGQQQVCATSVEESCLCCKESGQDRSQATTYTMHGRGSYRIVDLQPVVDELNRIDHDRSANEADPGCTGG